MKHKIEIKMKTKFIFFILLIILSFFFQNKLSALPLQRNFFVDGVEYEILKNDSNSVMVSRIWDNFSETVVIPHSVEYADRIYSVTTIGEYVFSSSCITKVILPNSITTINGRAFESNSKLSRIIIPNNVEHILDAAFRSCKNLEEVIISNGVKTIGREAFHAANSLNSITLPSSLIFIGESAFRDSRFLSNIVIPDTVFIDRYAFHKTAWYESQQDGLVFLGKTLYEYKEKEVELDDSHKNKKYKKLLVRGRDHTNRGRMLEKTKIDIPDGTLFITPDSFYGCLGLTEIILPESLLGIGKAAFGSCVSLRSVDIPKQVKNISQHAFSHCTRLKKINVYWEDPSSVCIFNYRGEPDTNTWVWVRSKTSELIVPKGTKEKYEQMAAWKRFKIVERKK